MLRYVPSISAFWRVFIINGCWILSKAFFSSNTSDLLLATLFWLFKQHLLLRLHWELAISFTSVFLWFRFAILLSLLRELGSCSGWGGILLSLVPGALLVRAGPRSHLLARDFTINRDIAVCRCSTLRVVWTGIRGLTAFLTRPQMGRSAVELTFSTLVSIPSHERQAAAKVKISKTTRPWQ